MTPLAKAYPQRDQVSESFGKKKNGTAPRPVATMVMVAAINVVPTKDKFMPAYTTAIDRPISGPPPARMATFAGTRVMAGKFLCRLTLSNPTYGPKGRYGLILQRGYDLIFSHPYGINPA